MGIYSICMGKGVILSTDILLEKFKLLIPELLEKHDQDHWIVLDILIKSHIDPKMTLCFLGHDAFESRSNLMKVLDGTPNSRAMSSIIKWKYDNDNKTNETGYKLCFVGIYEDLDCDGEFEYRVKTPELLYGLPAVIPLIVQLYPKLLSENYANLAKLAPEQEPCIWTFAGDCHCCT